MYECIYGFTPFACDDRQETKLKILNHRKTLQFPASDRPLEPSVAALDLMMQILVEKEKRLCSMQYHANDYGRVLQGTQIVRCRMDKTHPDYPGYFVFPNDADDIKRHPFFKGVDWKRLHDYRPPHMPLVRHCLDTKYFDDEGPVSDLDSGSSVEEEDAHNVQKIDPSERAQSSANSPVSVKPQGQHQQEAQNVVPSFSMTADPKPTREVADQSHPKGHLLAPRNTPVASVKGPAHTSLDFAIQVDGPPEKIVPMAFKPRKKEKKRARDIILRDPSTSMEAMRTRKATAFLGYDYRKPAELEHILEQAIIEDRVAQAVKRQQEKGHYKYYDEVFTSSARSEQAGHVHPAIKTRL